MAGTDFHKALQPPDYRAVLDRPEVKDATARLLFDEGMTGVAYVAPDGRFMRANPAYCDLVGYTEYELQFRTFSDITLPGDVAADEAEAGRVRDGDRASYTMEKTYIRKDGRPVRVELRVDRVADGAGGFVLFVGQAREMCPAAAGPGLTAPLTDLLARLLAGLLTNRPRTMTFATLVALFGTGGVGTIAWTAVRNHVLLSSQVEQQQQQIADLRAAGDAARTAAGRTEEAARTAVKAAEHRSEEDRRQYESLLKEVRGVKSDLRKPLEDRQP